MIKFDNWRILNQGKVLARQYDNLTRELRVEGIIPEGWTWDLLVQAGKNLDIIRLNQGENSLSVMLTSEMLALAGYYVLQLRATQGEKVRHTNVLRVYVPESLSGDGHWPEVPSEFTQLEQRVRELSEEAGAAAEQAENAAEGVANNAKAAQEAAGQAQTAQDAAQGSAKQAGAAAAASAELAKTAADSAAAATQAAQSASDAVSSAQTSVQTATAQAQAAADAAQQARQAQQAVETAAGNAAQSAQAAAEAQTQVAQVGAQVSADAEDARDAVTKSTAAAAQAGESARVAQEAAQQALGSVLPPATGLPDGYSLQTQGGQAVWGESAGGGSEMEFINSMTLDADVTSGRIDVDAEGNPFVLSEAVATVSFVNGQEVGLFYWYFTKGIDFYLNKRTLGGNGYKLVASGNSVTGVIFVYQENGSTNTLNTKLVTPGTEITMFRFANFDGVPLKAGTAISLYGKRKAV
ncbi:hypothetical protein [Flavonifractor sp. An4]|uniref:hypothetical protein n=1 Tax=Flavonifractor sp. An4 TaxID=1965634 RepID=UPI000B399D4F|nr:hypothetical protein [Flavonifractor sp. An4]OUO07944.1 hypothetical protein B5F94_15600 [Flavonifractor sp. An4]